MEGEGRAVVGVGVPSMVEWDTGCECTSGVRGEGRGWEGEGVRCKVGDQV